MHLKVGSRILVQNENAGTVDIESVTKYKIIICKYIAQKSVMSLSSSPLLVECNEMSFGVDVTLSCRGRSDLIGDTQHLVVVPSGISLHREENDNPARAIGHLILKVFRRGQFDLQLVTALIITLSSTVIHAMVGRGQRGQTGGEDEVGNCTVITSKYVN